MNIEATSQEHFPTELTGPTLISRGCVWGTLLVCKCMYALHIKSVSEGDKWTDNTKHPTSWKLI